MIVVGGGGMSFSFRRKAGRVVRAISPSLANFLSQRLPRAQDAGAQASGPNHSELEVDVALRSLDEWHDFAQRMGPRLSREAAQRLITQTLQNGVTCGFFGKVEAAEVSMQGKDAREGLLVRGLNSRQRAVLNILMSCELAHVIHGTRIYAHEALTPVALALRGRYPYFLGSEYAEDAAMAERLWPIPAIDILQSGLPDQAFHFVLSNEVLEHVPDIDAALRDTFRILKPGGRFIATVPFLAEAQDTQIRARLTEHGIEHILPPEYHGNPTRPDEGSLVFQIPGWDVLDRCRKAGFSDAWMRFVSSSRAGITATGPAGIFVLEAER